MDKRKVIKDWVIATQEAIFILQEWVGQLERWQSKGRAEPDDFAEACLQLREAGLGRWAREAGGHGIQALAEALEVDEGSVDLTVTESYRWPH